MRNQLKGLKSRVSAIGLKIDLSERGRKKAARIIRKNNELPWKGMQCFRGVWAVNAKNADIKSGLSQREHKPKHVFSVIYRKCKEPVFLCK